MKLDEQAEIVRYLEKLYLSNGGFKFRYIGDDAIKLYHDDGTETIFKVIDGVVTAVTAPDATQQPTTGENIKAVSEPIEPTETDAQQPEPTTEKPSSVPE